ncbi:hypothetical protein [Corallococcus macrosporus]|uniref:Uncharacterized protein n=2 Tax=Myxococcaceae TaxID=31 RepID=A0A286NVS6_9BACT|nr:hypothetical protein [Corallococcus macrosporus]AEI63957.1 hypothetical protein LILAB_10230 [Corallococcus macrosporus]ATB51271.1 hypothetical protein MYMAC_006929 [Corallococcus macrosporus DSM 14697]
MPSQSSSKTFRTVTVVLAALALGFVVVTSTRTCSGKPKPKPFIGGTKMSTLYGADVDTLGSPPTEAPPPAR